MYAARRSTPRVASCASSARVASCRRAALSPRCSAAVAVWLLWTCRENRAARMCVAALQKASKEIPLLQYAAHACSLRSFAPPLLRLLVSLRPLAMTPTDVPRTPSDDALCKGAQPSSGFRSGRPILADFGGSPRRLEAALRPQRAKTDPEASGSSRRPCDTAARPPPHFVQRQLRGGSPHQTVSA